MHIKEIIKNKWQNTITLLAFVISVISLFVSCSDSELERENEPLDPNINYVTSVKRDGTISINKKVNQGKIKADYMAKVIDTPNGKKVILKYFGDDVSKIILKKEDSKFLLHKDKNGYYISGFFVYINMFDNLPYLDYVYIPSSSMKKRSFDGKSGTAIDNNKLIAPSSIDDNLNRVNRNLKSKKLNNHSEVNTDKIVSDRSTLLKYLNQNIK